MIENPTLQVQAVLFNDEIEPLKKTIYAMANAVRVEHEKAGILKKVKFVYGDASEKPVLMEEDIQEIREKIGSLTDFEYRTFGFNTGYGKGNNLLAENSGADYLLIINPDIIVSPRTLIDLMEPFADEKVGIVEARQTPVEHHKEYDIKTKETDWASGACFMIPARIFESLNGFDSDTFFMYCEDVDLSWRLRLEGYKIIYQPLSPVYHAKRLSVNGSWKPSKSEIYYSAESTLLMAYKWSNEVLLQKHIYNYQSSDLSEHKKAVRHFLKLKEAGKLPEQLDGQHKVSRFVGNYYTDNRFIL